MLAKYEEWAILKNIYRSIERRYLPISYKTLTLFGQDFVGSHASALMVRDTIGSKRFEQYCKFCTVRNPWDREVSRYFFARKVKTHKLHEMANRYDFKDFIKWRSENEISRGVRGYQFKKISDRQGNLIVDHIIHLENLREEILPVLKKIGIKTTIVIPELNKSSHNSYQHYYDSESVDLVQNFSQDDIENLGYVF